MSFTYDATGRMTSRTEGTQTQYYVYDAYSMLIGVYEDQNLTQPIVAHVYDDRGQRVQKDSYQGGALAKRTYYVRDVGGNVLAIYEQDVASSQPTAEVAEYPIYGLGRIGSWYALPGGTLALDGYQITDGDEDLPQYVPGTTPNYLYQGEDVVTLQQGFEVSWQTATDNMFHVAPLFALRDENSELYELTDHLGNVRVTVGREKAVDNTAETIGYTDYYPFGQPLPSQRSVGSPKYRYGYQGQFAEYDEDESGLHHFELREYDSRLGRMLIPDPYGQFASPYIAMGNNPANLVDADGGYAGPGPRTIMVDGQLIRLLDDVIITYTGTATQVIVGGIGGTLSGVYEHPLNVNYSSQDIRFSFAGVSPVKPMPFEDFIADRDIYQNTDLINSYPQDGITPFHFTTTPDDIAAPFVSLSNGDFGGAAIATAALILPTKLKLKLPPSSKVLGQNLITSGIVRPANTAAHHIVAGGHRNARIARSILNREGININDPFNGVFLPKNTKFANYPNITHSRIHTTKYFNAINNRLLNAAPGTVSRELQLIRQEILNGTFPY